MQYFGRKLTLMKHEQLKDSLHLTAKESMKKLTIILAGLAFIVGCTVSESPEFIDMNNYQVKKVTMQEVVVTTDVNFHNPNDIGCSIVKTDIDVKANGVNVGKVDQNAAITIDANNNFHLPVSVKFSPKKVFGSKDGSLLNGMLNTLTSKEVELQYVGYVTINKLGIDYSIDIDETETIPLKKAKS